MKKNRAILKSREPEAETPAAPSPVLVRVVRQAIHEAGRNYAAGQTFEVAAERRAALGGLVEEVRG